MADIRVTQAGRQAPTQEDADVRVTQAGRQAVTQETADIRVTQAGRQVAEQQTDQNLRVTMLGRQVLMPDIRPTTPTIISPNDTDTYSIGMTILHVEAVDPIGGTTTHTFRYRKVGDTIWITAFTGRSGAAPYAEDISALVDGTYEAECWATNVGGSGKDSSTATVTFTIDNTTPGPPEITAPYDNQEWIQGTQRVEWTAASDPTDDPLTYKLDYRAVGAGSWTPIDTGVTTLYYDWNMAALAADDYEIRVYANDGTADGPADIALFTVVTADQPIKPVLRISGLSDSCVTVELNEYDHPNSRAWKSTTYVVIPYDGDPTNPVISYTTTDSLEQLEAQLCSLAYGFHGQVRAYFTDNLDQDGNPSGWAEFIIGDQSRNFIQRWDDDALWTGGPPGEIVAQNAQDGLGWGGLNSEQELASVILGEAIEVGSAFVSGGVMLGGCNCGWIGRDTELRQLGIGVFEGFRDDSTWVGIAAYLDTGIGGPGGVTGGGTLYADLAIEAKWPDGTRSYTYISVNGIMMALASSITSSNGSPIGDWSTTEDRYPWYRIELLVNRNIGASPTTRIRARVLPAEGYNVPVAEEPLDAVPDGEWHIDVTYNKLGPCGRAGYVMGQLSVGFGLSAKTYFRDLEYTALRDAGLPVASNELQPGYTGPAGPGSCIVQSESALTTPVFFPVPPNGDVEERVSYPTDVIGAWDDSEQRISLRERGRRTVAWRGTVLSTKETTDLLARLYDDQPSRWGVPLWQDAAPLLADLASSASSIPAASVDTTDLRFENMTHVALYVDQFTWHFTEAVLENDGSITLTDQTTQAFTGGAKGPTFVLPCRVGRMPQSLRRRRAAPFMADVDFEFVLEGVND